MHAQVIIDDSSWNRNFNAEVKSLDEFAARFNGIESHPEIPVDSLSSYSNLKALFDLNTVIESENPSQFTNHVKAFCDSVLIRDIRFSLCNGSVFVLAKCKVKFEKKLHTIHLILVQEETMDGYTRWGIVGVTDLISSGIIKTSKFFNISPVEHEIHFMGLNDILNNNRHKAFGYRGLKDGIDQLSVFLTLIQSNLIDFLLVEELRILCLNVPGFIYTITEEIRETTNSGWLITDLFPATDEEKVMFINDLFLEQ